MHVGVYDCMHVHIYVCLCAYIWRVIKGLGQGIQAPRGPWQPCSESAGFTRPSGTWRPPSVSSRVFCPACGHIPFSCLKDRLEQI